MHLYGRNGYRIDYHRTMEKTPLCHFLGIEKPIISGGMVWCSGYKLATAVSNSGGLGLLGAGSMYPPVLREHIQKAKNHTSKPFGVNVPLMYPDLEEIMDIIMEEQVPVVVTSAGSPNTWTQRLKSQGIKVMHVVSNATFARKAQDAGVDAVIAEGVEAGGHNGREETTTLCLIPNIIRAVDVPVVAAGGIASGGAILAMRALGAQAVQIGTLFAVSEESSAHTAYKELCVQSGEGDTVLALKKIAPVRMLRNPFLEQVLALENAGAPKEQLQELLGRGRAKKGIFLGDLLEGEMESGQTVSQITSIDSVATIMERLEQEYHKAWTTLCAAQTSQH